MSETTQTQKVLVVGHDSAADSSAGAIARLLYDADAEQRFTFDVTDDEAEYSITQVFGGLPDDALAEYDRLRELLLEGDGKNTDLKTNTVEADEYLFNELCKDVLGYDGEKPENWQDDIDYEEKKCGIKNLLTFQIVRNDKPKPKKTRIWGKPTSSNSIEIESYFGEDEKGIPRKVKTKAIFDRKTPADVAAYAVLKNRVSLVDNGLDESAIKIPASMKRKADLFDKMNPRTEGYAGRVPLHHKAAFISELFELKVSNTEKK